LIPPSQNRPGGISIGKQDWLAVDFDIRHHDIGGAVEIFQPNLSGASQFGPTVSVDVELIPI
jgi:hypothetical protein